MARAVLLVMCGSALAACVFDDGVGDGARVLCADDAACPSEQRCDLVTHVCVPPGGDARGPVATSAAFQPAEAGAGQVTLVVEATRRRPL